MKSLLLFAATSLILVVAIVAVAVPIAVQAEKPHVKWCIDGGAGCGETKKDCKILLGDNEGKCVRTPQP